MAKYKSIDKTLMHTYMHTKSKLFVVLDEFSYTPTHTTHTYTHIHIYSHSQTH
jgi:hypothetical protein